jgi:cell division protein FtsW (lipid II flippase)
MKPMKALLLIVIVGSVVFGLGRFTVAGHDATWPQAYQDFAHIWVGMLLMLSMIWFVPTWTVRRWAIICLVAITALEAVMFFAR